MGHGWFVGGIRFGQKRNMNKQVPCTLPPQFLPQRGWICFDKSVTRTAKHHPHNPQRPQAHFQHNYQRRPHSVEDAPPPSPEDRKFGYPQYISNLVNITWLSDVPADAEVHTEPEFVSPFSR